MVGVSGSLICSKALMELIFNPCGEFRLHSPQRHAGASGIFSNLLRSVQMLKREWDAKSNGNACIFEVLRRVNILGHRRPEWMIMDDNDVLMIFGEPWGVKLPDIYLTGEKKPRKNRAQETCPDRGSNQGPLRDRSAATGSYPSIHPK